MTTDARLVRKGQREPTSGILEEGRAHQQLATELATKLEEHGWPGEQTTALGADVDDLSARVGKREIGWTDVDEAVAAETNARHAIKALFADLRRAVKLALRRGSVEGVTAEAFNGITAVADNTPELLIFVDERLPKVRLMDEAVKPFLAGRVASVELEGLRGTLDDANKHGNTGRTATPVETEELYELKGRILEAIEDINDIGRIAYAGNATMLARFNKDLLLRARRTKKKVETTPEVAPEV